MRKLYLLFLLLPLLLIQSVKADVKFNGPKIDCVIGQYWYKNILPSYWITKDVIQVHLLKNPDMELSLMALGCTIGVTDSEPSYIQGLFVLNTKQILIRLDRGDGFDIRTLSHEYGHYVWYNILTDKERKAFTEVYNNESANNTFLSNYASSSIKEDFAEDFSYYIVSPDTVYMNDECAYNFFGNVIVNHFPNVKIQNPLEKYNGNTKTYTRSDPTINLLWIPINRHNLIFRRISRQYVGTDPYREHYATTRPDYGRGKC